MVEGETCNSAGKIWAGMRFLGGAPLPLFSRKVFRDKDLTVKYSGITT